MNDGTCNHGGCHCKGAELQSDGYCSESCRNGNMQNGDCGCGHRDCH